jgi:iron complex outermembrane receptor protein
MMQFQLTAIAAAISAFSSGAAAAAATAAPQVDEVVVTGARVSDAKAAIGADKVTATVAITRAALLSAPAGITGLKMLESLPGFNVQANDALGLYEFGNSVSVRAFQFSQIGFLLDNIPMGRSDAFGGSPIYRYVDNETTDRLTASSGAGDVALPSYASLGPIVQYTTLPPGPDAGLVFNGTVGSDNLHRVYGRAELGEHHGFSGYVAGSWLRGDNWRSPGFSERKHVEGKLRYDFGGGADLTFQTVHNRYNDFDSPDISLAQYQAQGRDIGYLGVLPPPVGAFAPTTPGVTYSNANYGSYYKFATNNRVDHLYGLTLNVPVVEHVKATGTAYYESKGGFGVSPDSYSNSLTQYTREISAGVTGITPPLGIQYGLSKIDGTRTGFVGRGEAAFGANTVSGGFWVERDIYHRLTARYNLTNGAPDGSPLFDQEVFKRRDFTSTRDTRQFFLKDTLALLDGRLKLDAGFKTLDVSYHLKGYRDFTDYWAHRGVVITADWRKDFLPQVGAVYDVTPRDQVFASYSEQMALPRGADDNYTLTPSNSTPAKPDQTVTPTPKAETAKNVELGYRANHRTFNASVAFYGTEFNNRLQSYSTLVPGSVNTFETYYHNVGKVQAYGVELSGQWKPELFGGMVFFNSNFTYNHSTFRNDVLNPDGTVLYAIKGKTTPDSPRVIYQGGMTVQPRSWALFNVSVKYVGSRKTNYVNTESLPGYAVVNAYVDLGDGWSLGPFKQIKARLNVDNLLDKSYLGTIDVVSVTGPSFFRPGPARTVQFTLSSAL